MDYSIAAGILVTRPMAYSSPPCCSERPTAYFEGCFEPYVDYSSYLCCLMPLLNLTKLELCKKYSLKVATERLFAIIGMPIFEFS